MHTKLKKWIKWVEIIEKEIYFLIMHSHVYDEVGEIIRTNIKIQKPSAFYELLNTGYAALALSTIRRQIKNNNDSISLLRLMKEIVENPELISREYILSFYDLEIKMGNAEIDTLIGTGRKIIDPLKVEEDLFLLKESTISIEDFVDKRIAHTDIRKVEKIPTFDELKDAIDIIFKLTQKYYFLISGNTMSSEPPVFQYDWKAIFKEKWID